MASPDGEIAHVLETASDPLMKSVYEKARVVASSKSASYWADMRNTLPIGYQIIAGSAISSKRILRVSWIGNPDRQFVGYIRFGCEAGSKEVQLLSTDIVLMLGRWVRVVDLVLNPDDPVVESVELLLLDPGRLTTPPSTIPVDAL